jgi:hypothetical protein
MQQSIGWTILDDDDIIQLGPEIRVKRPAVAHVVVAERRRNQNIKIKTTPTLDYTENKLLGREMSSYYNDNPIVEPFATLSRSRSNKKGMK